MDLLKALLVTAVAIPAAYGQFCEHQWQGKWAKREVNAVQARDSIDPPDLEIRPLIVNGPSRNRVDFIFLGDGYTSDEKDKFFADAQFLAENITNGHTFYDVLPLLNFWAGFTPSTDSGIGTGGVPKNTVYGLYRDGTELRGVYYDKPEIAHAACDSTDTCDYPILLGNDPLYGGLGGEFTVITSSPTNGPAILRHELGHSIIGVGEEYDGGEIYEGVNSAPNTSAVPWEAWYTNSSLEPKIQRSNMPIQAYPWTLLNTTQGWSQNFTSAGTYNTHLVQVSLSGMTASSDLLVEIDGNDVGWEINPEVGVDRYIYNMKVDEALAPGEHEIKVTLLNGEIEGSAQLCNLEVIEYGEEFDFDTGYYGLYPTFSDLNVTTYRPTNDLCLMRSVYSVDFCEACIEGLWLSLLDSVKLIENFTEIVEPNPDGSTLVKIDLLPLGKYRTINTTHAEEYEILWYGGEENIILEDWTNKTHAFIVPDTTEFGIEVRFWSDQIRSPNNTALIDKRRFRITG
ncbi:IgA peptidase M64-domain-containing protein [Annulohypoxylon truncatum]|uniref:IgA peptidase M64-domain-containing protein n=1 Tax=Annulohypoxylon truncatum TaxID=327061 RepID=UPI002008562E|nr:IgA peptidase M64-domain-containing protein [Annulohypoxylon truncatum]KAI1212081.1 IgA peptidase M64-domain-containing protein [Annulohypoxylon truncatum]